jgi:hypothetical protein
MEPKNAHGENEKKHATSQLFRFVDQTDRSEKAVREHKTQVRSHVMTEIRRQKRSKDRIEPEICPDLNDSHRGTNDLSLDKAPRLQPHAHLVIDQVAQVDSSLVDNLLPGLDDSHERQQAENTGRPSDLWPDGVPSHHFQPSPSDLEPPWAHITSSAETVGLNASSEHEVLPQDHRYEDRSNAKPDQPQSFTASPTLLGTSRVDPFRVLPIPSNREVNELVDNCTSIS